MLTTPNLALKKPEANDTVNIADLNYNADVLDQEVVKRLVNSGGVPSIQAGPDASKPAPGTAGRLYVATDTQIIYRDTGSAWTKVGAVKWGDIDGKPSSFTPSAHKTTHATGGADALAPADIGAASAADLAAHLADKANPHQVTAAQTGALVSVDRVSNAGGNIDLVAGANIAITPDNTNKQITIAGIGTWPNADTVDGYHAGNSSGQVPVSNGTVNTNLNADLLDGSHKADITRLSAMAVVKASGSITVSANTIGTVNLNAGDSAHRFYIYSVYTSGAYVFQGTYVTPTEQVYGGPHSFIARADVSTAYDRLWIVNGLDSSKTIYYKVYQFNE